MTAARKLLALIALALLTILPGGESAAQNCPIQVSVSGRTITATTSGDCGHSSIIINRDDRSPVVNHTCYGQTDCTASYTLNVCSAPRVYEFWAYGICGRSGTTPNGEPICYVPGSDEGRASINLVPIPPEVDGHYIPGPNGAGTLSVSYSFPEGGLGGINVYRNDETTPFRSAGGPTLLEDEGVWETPLDVSCWPEGTHRLRFEAATCGRFDDAAYKGVGYAEIEVENTPAVSLSAPAPVNGEVTFTADYTFQNTTQGTLSFWVDDTYYGSWGPFAGSGTWTHTLPLGSCWQNARVVVNGCSQTAEDEVTTEERTPMVSVTSQRGPRGANGYRRIKGRIAYNMRDAGTQPWSVRAWISKWVDNAGVEHPASIDLPLTPSATGQSGVKTFEIDAPHGARQIWVITEATNCAGTTVDDTLVHCDPCDASADPVFFGDGNVLVNDADPLPPIAGNTLTRAYNSDEQVAGLFGRGWTTLFDRRLTVHAEPGGQRVVLTTETNEAVVFRLNGGAYVQTWPRGTRSDGTLSYDGVADRYSYRAAGSTQLEIFRGGDGRLVELRQPGTGHAALIDYQNGLPSTFTDSWSGTSWAFTVVNQRVTAISVNGLSWTYQYDASGNQLTSVLAPGGSTWRTYEYTADLLTASRDPLGNLIESHTYDADGYGVSSTGPADEIASIQYDIAGSIPEETVTRVTMKTGAITDYILRPSGGAYRIVEVRGGGCVACGGSSGDRTYVRDADGRIVREQTADGYVTVRIYDGDLLVSEERYLRPSSCDPQTDTDRCRMTTDSLAAATLTSTPSTIETTFQYTDPVWPERVTITETPGVVVPGALRRGEVTYHPFSGDVLTRSMTGHANAEQSVTRGTTTSFYESTPQGDQDAPSLTPAFDPGGAFQSSWMSLSQPAGLVRSIDGPRGDAEDVTSFVHYPIDASVPASLRGRLAATRSAAGHITRFESYDVFGNVTRTIDANGVATERTYDNLGRPKTATVKGIPGCNTTKDPLCGTDLTTTRNYAPAAGPLQSEERAGGGTTIYTYDDRGRVETTSRGPSATDLRERLESTYDPLTGKRSRERRLAFENGAWVEKYRESYAYDIDGHLQTVTRADGATVTYDYDAAGRLESIRDELHADANTKYTYDPAGRIATIEQKLSGGWIETIHQYDIHGNRTSISDPEGNVTQYSYDDFGETLTEQSPVTGLTRRAYDAAGNLTSTTDANSITTTRKYDALNRVVAQRSSASSGAAPADENNGRPGETQAPATQASTESVTWTYDDATPGRFAIGRLSSTIDFAGRTVYEYERRGLLTQEVRTFSGCLNRRETLNCAAYWANRTYTTGYGYDQDGNRSSVRYPSSLTNVTYTFDYAGRPLSASSAVSSAKYLPYGPLKELTFANGMVQAIEHDARYRIFTNGLKSGASTIAGYVYHHDAAGNITGIDDATNANYNRSLGYDGLHRLTTATTGSALWQTGGFSWDEMGNLVSSSIGSENQTFAYHGTTARVASVTTNGVTTGVAHDAAGNERSFIATRTYSPRNLLQEVSRPASGGGTDRVFHSYDGRGVRVITGDQPANTGQLSRRYFFYTPELRYLGVTFDDTDAQGVAQKDLRHAVIWFGERPVAQVQYGGTVRYTFTDHIATPILQTDGAGNVVWRAEYEPFGDIHVLRAGQATDQPLRFAGQDVAIHWEGSEERYNIFRWYRSGWGRYTQADPIGMRGGLNLYRYAGANPLSNIDPLGLVQWSCNIGYISYETPGAGAGGATMGAQCQSECVNKKRVNATVVGNLGGASALSPLPGGVSYSTNVTLEDDFTEPKEDALDGLFVIGSIGGGVGFGPLNWSFTYYRLGAANGTSTGVSSFMVSLGIDAYIGVGTVVESNTECCR
jgi:RHS repeat-associated protein